MRDSDAVGLVQVVHNSGSPKAVAGVQLTGFTDAAGTTTTYRRDAVGQVAEVSNPGSGMQCSSAMRPGV